MFYTSLLLFSDIIDSCCHQLEIEADKNSQLSTDEGKKSLGKYEKDGTTKAGQLSFDLYRHQTLKHIFLYHFKTLSNPAWRLTLDKLASKQEENKMVCTHSLPLTYAA